MGWLRRHWIAVTVSAVLFFLGVGIGASPSEEDGSDNAAAAETIRETATKSVITTVRSDAKERKELADAIAFVDKRRDQLVARKKALDARQKALDAREAAISGEEERIEASTFTDGAYLVGTDIPPGNYIAEGGEGCYWARKSADGTSILDNHFQNTAGQVRATVNSGELFETNGCGTWGPG